MSCREVTHQSWGQRLINSTLMALLGLLMLVGGCVLLFWNEGRAVKTTMALEEGQEVVRPVHDPTQVEALYEGKLVYIKGRAKSNAQWHDEEFGFSYPAMRLERHIEYYQWVEEEETHEQKEMGGGSTTVTTYHYYKQWCDEPVYSGHFHESGHHNNVAYHPQKENARWQAKDVALGAYRLNPGQVARVGELMETSLHGLQLPEALAARSTVRHDELYIGTTTPNPDDPAIGTVRVCWQFVPQESDVSLVAQQQGNSFVPYVARSSGYEVDLLCNGLLSCQEVFEQAHEDNTLTTWFLRAGGTVLVFVALSLMTHIISVLGDIIPFIGTLLGWGTRLASFVGALIISLLTIALAWFWYRPLLSLVLVCVACLPWLWRRWQQRQA